MYLRSLGSSCELLEFTVVDGEVGTEVTAELQGLEAAVEGRQKGMCKARVTRRSPE